MISKKDREVEVKLISYQQVKNKCLFHTLLHNYIQKDLANQIFIDIDHLRQRPFCLKNK